MNTSVKNFFIFAAGAAIGSAVTWYFIKTKYEQIAQEEIDSVKEVFSRREKIDDDKVKSEESMSKPDIREYAARLGSEGYTDYSSIPSSEEDEDPQYEPYVIRPEEYGCCPDDYEIISLNYFSDDILADDWDNKIEDVEGLVGLDFAEHFGDYEEDCVHIRNGKRKVDIEIVRDPRSFSDVANRNPHLTEDE